MTVKELVELARTKPRDEAFALLDEWAKAKPELVTPVALAKAILEPLYEAGEIGQAVGSGLQEVLGLIQNGHGPVGKAPESGLF